MLSHPALCSCKLLGELRKDGYELARPGKADAWMKVPLLATCCVMQRLLMAERQRNARLQERVQELEAAVAGSSQAATGGGTAGAGARRAPAAALAGKAAAIASDTPGGKAREAGIET